MKTVRSEFLQGFLGMAAVLGVLSLLSAAVAVVTLHVSFAPVLTGSMRPTFAPGAAVVTREVPRSQVRDGDVLVFRPPGHVDSFAHRVVAVSDQAGTPVVTTRGDANPANDPWRAQLVGASAQQVVFAVPELGRVLVALHEPQTRSLALALAGLVFAAVGVRAVLSSTGSTLSRHTPSHVG